MTDVKTKLMRLGPPPKLLSLGEVLDAFMKEFEARSLASGNNEECSNVVSGSTFGNSSNHFDFVESKVDNVISMVRAQFMAEYMKKVETDVRYSFSTQTTGLCLYRFDALCEEVVEVVRFLMSSHGDNLMKKLEIFFRQVLYTSQAFYHDGNINPANLNRAICSITREELRIRAVVKNADKLKMLVMQRLSINDAGAVQCGALHRLIEMCASTRANLAKSQFNLFIALEQLKKLQGVVEESNGIKDDDDAG
eukprot:6195836-Pleurochrysis_carterae.AAC.1